MGGIYGISKAAKANEEGRYEAATEEATRAAALDPEDPEPRVERAFALSYLGRFGEAAEDLEAALGLDVEAQVLDDTAVDDALFGALLGAARKDAQTSLEAALHRLGRYAELLPRGAHLAEAADWARRLRGELKVTEIVKQKV